MNPRASDNKARMLVAALFKQHYHLGMDDFSIASYIAVDGNRWFISGQQRYARFSDSSDKRSWIGCGGSENLSAYFIGHRFFATFPIPTKDSNGHSSPCVLNTDKHSNGMNVLNTKNLIGYDENERRLMQVGVADLFTGKIESLDVHILNDMAYFDYYNNEKERLVNALLANIWLEMIKNRGLKILPLDPLPKT